MPITITIRTPLGALLKEHAEARGENLEDIAYVTRVPRTSLYSWIGAAPGARLPLVGLLQLRRYLDIPWDVFEQAALSGVVGESAADVAARLGEPPDEPERRRRRERRAAGS